MAEAKKTTKAAAEKAAPKATVKKTVAKTAAKAPAKTATKAAAKTPAKKTATTRAKSLRIGVPPYKIYSLTAFAENDQSGCGDLLHLNPETQLHLFQ